MMRPAFTPFARSCLLGLALGALACAIFALLLGKAESAASRREPAAAQPAPEPVLGLADGKTRGAWRGIGRDGRSPLRLVGGVLVGERPVSGPLPPVACGNFAEMAEGLSTRFGEVLAARGQIGPDVLLVVLASPAGSFTVLAVRATGTACVVAAGRGWENVTQDGGGL